MTSCLSEDTGMTTLEGLQEARHEFEIKENTCYLKRDRVKYRHLRQAVEDAIRILQEVAK